MGWTEHKIVLKINLKVIKLTDVLPIAKFTTTNTREMDKDPKVSGKNYISKNIGTKTLAVTYESGNWTVAIACAETDTDVKITTALTTKGCSFRVKDAYNDSTGHKAEWELNVDTEFINKIAGTDKKVNIYAKIPAES